MSLRNEVVMFGSLDKYIRRLTPEEIEHRQLTRRQISRRARIASKTRAVQVTNTATDIINLIEDDGSNDGIDIVDAVQSAVNQLLQSEEIPLVISSTAETVDRPKRSTNFRPHNWKDVADHFLTYRKHHVNI